jgi:hypothetical protein
VPGLDLLEGRRDQQVAALGAVRRLVFQEPGGPRQPAAALGQLPPFEQDEAQPEGTQRGPAAVAVAGEELLGPLHGREAILDPPGEVGGGRQQLEVAGGQGG